MFEGVDDDDAPLDQMWQTVHEMLVETITAYLVVEVMGDLLPVGMQTWGQGVVLTSLGPAGVAPDPRWQCSGSVAATIAALVRATPIGDLVAASLAWDEMASDERCWRIAALELTGSSHSPAVWELLDRVSVRSAQVQLALAGHQLITLQQWANALATILTYQGQLDDELVATFLSTGRRVSRLATLLSVPLGAQPRRMPP